MPTNNELFKINAAFITGNVSSKEMESLGAVSQGNGTSGERSHFDVSFYQWHCWEELGHTLCFSCFSIAMIKKKT